MNDLTRQSKEKFEGDNYALWQSRAVAYEFLAFSFRYPDAFLVEAIISGEWLETRNEIREVFHLDKRMPGTNFCAYYTMSQEVLLRRLRTESTRLFVGPSNVVASPYESVWRQNADGVQALLFVNSYSMNVERFMKACGVKQAEGKNEPLDHVATEMEFLHYLCLLEEGITQAPSFVSVPEAGWGSEHNRFIEEHIQTWIPQFTDAILSNTSEQFYLEAASLLKSLTE